MKLDELINNIPAIEVIGNTDIEITGITKDSRKAKEGYIFFATEKSERFINDAADRGASVIVSDGEVKTNFPCSIKTDDPKGLLGNIASKFYGFPSKKLYIIGITGTNGKTTTTYLIESMLNTANKKAGLIGTISYRYDGRTFKAFNTTPGAEELHSLLHDMKLANMEYVVMEVSSHALDQKRVEGVDFDTAIFTNLTHDHLDYHGTFENYKAAKNLFFSHFLKKSSKKEKYAIINADDPNADGFMPGPPIRTLLYSLKKTSDAYITTFREDIGGLQLEMKLMGKPLSIVSPLIGVFNVSNILAASLAGYAVNMPHEQIKKGLEGLEGVPGRLERVKNGKGAYIFIDYAHTPDALKKVLEMLNSLKKGKLTVIFGCGGDRDREKRPVMGNIASQLADYTIITSDNPRSESPMKIIEDVKKGFIGNTCRIVENRKDAIFEGIKIIRQDDILLIAGKGHEDYQIIGDKVFHFSDREVVEEFLDVAC
ncbi:MAG: UDP-N-acetylmuramoyl-L-alanyl-D-glutamate--2,6-diaminopimelate ligase [Proteobacteria bacterium]|nr:UDP-N-acetylmuramoyl-L-alanyl-D-glutamate--2,6-diaminopimelate ligase [Pseudomonadota bacterium]